MGKKGAKRTAQTDAALDDLVMALGEHLDVTSKAMFGGYGISSGGVMFALIDPDGNVFLRTDDQNLGDYDPATKHGRMPYHQLPVGAIDDPGQLGQLATASLAAAKRAKK